ncbi:pentapeptide repeat-containing protein [Halomicrobium salinisoli]|uniref:pentapeptide repeat-containing protein n=1 Tax=Halomicrobium salinisoli TaxID=2878391 RepID=UPI001CEFF331|nr:pentapeptide repeat-containing protein [Halomicrobium salinisoli]
MPSDSSDRCGYRLNVGVDEVGSGEPCDRPTWEDHDRCVWHAEVDGKTQEQLEDARSGGDDDLDGAYLRGASLVGVDWFADASLVGADFSDATLVDADLSGADLTLATLTDANGINADFAGANLEGAIFTNADLRRANLLGAYLNDAVLTDVHVGEETDFGDLSVYEREAVEPGFGSNHPLEAASWTYRELQQLYRDNALPKLARRSYNLEKDARRRLAWTQRDYGNAIKWEVSRWVMRYGSSPYRVLLVSLFVIVVCALLFPLTGGIQETQGGQAITYTIEDPEATPLWWTAEILYKSLYFSMITFATLGYGDIQPVGPYARMLAAVETIIGSLLSAILVFVLTRIVTW